MQKTQKVEAFVDGEVLVLDHFSGIGHYTAALLSAVDELLGTEEYAHFDITIGLPRKLQDRIQRFGYKNFKYKTMPFSPRITNGLKRRGLIPPIDLLFGKKTYVFPHFTTWPTLSSPQIPIIYDLSFVHFPQHSAEKNQQFLESQTEISAKRAARIITISKNSKKEIVEHYKVDDERVDIIVPVLDRVRFCPRSEVEIRNIRAKYGIFDKYILFVGNIEPRKNLVGLLKAYKELDASLQDEYALLLVGAKGWKDGEIHDLIGSLRAEGKKVIQPSDYVVDEDLPALITGASVFAYVSVYEGYGIPPTEAMACGTPVIAFDCGSVPEVVDHRETGFIVNTVSEAVRAVRQLHSFDRVHCRNVFERRFSARRMAQDYVKLYERHIEQRRKMRVITKHNRQSLGTFRLTAGL